MYRLKVKCGGVWRTGKVEYRTREEVENRRAEMSLKGIRTKIIENKDLFR